MLTTFITVIHILASLILILVVLAQQGKGQDLASAFGGGGSASAFGARGTATVLSKITTIVAVLFMLTSLGLSYFSVTGTRRTVVPDDAGPAAVAPTDATTDTEGSTTETGVETPAAGDETTPDGEVTTEPPEEKPEGETEQQPDPEKPPQSQ